MSAAYEFYAYLDLDLLLILLLVQAQHILGWHEACCLVSEIWLHGYFWHVLSFQLNLWNMCFSCGSEGGIIRSILITQKQCKITASLMIWLRKHRLHFHFPFPSNLNFIYKLIAELLAMQWIHLVRWLYLASSFFKICYCWYCCWCLTYFQIKCGVISFMVSCNVVLLTNISSWSLFLTKCTNYILSLVM